MKQAAKEFLFRGCFYLAAASAPDAIASASRRRACIFRRALRVESGSRQGRGFLEPSLPHRHAKNKAAS
jgi:hypothetical protein